MEQPMMIRKTPSPISVLEIDDGASYARLLQETCRLLFGTTDTITEATNLTPFRVFEGLVKQVPKDAELNKITSMASSDVVQRNKKKATLPKSALNRKPEGLRRPCDVVEQQQEKRLKSDLKRKSEDTDHDYHQNKSEKKSRSSNCSDIGGQMIMNLKRKSSKINNRFHKDKDLQISQQQPDPLSIKLKKQIEEERGSDIQLMIRKRITRTDLKLHNGRLSVSPNQLKDKALTFLTEQERSVVAKLNNELPVTLIQPCGNKTSLRLVRWSYDSSFTYMLRTGWNDVLKRNQRNHLQEEHFKADDVIQIWSFRVAGQLWLAIEKVQDAPFI